ncbi:phage head completion protein [Myroides odoratimimus]|uniref:phage head completion protein n=1 Tax=Myroides odoratimimus TaxID=76832 RepID=UPI0025755C1C|nr:head-tail adaptor protein [Myroides odoratimimus]MDM1057872.1 head-tail adaptor protein [Myroides odoratimimus]
MGIVNKPYIGSLDRKIKVLKVVKKRDATGQEKSVTEVFCEPWASLVDQAGGEQIDMAVMELSSRVYVVRWRKEIEKDGFEMLVEDSGIVYRIIHVGIINRKQYLQLKCTVYEQ